MAWTEAGIDTLGATLADACRAQMTECGKFPHRENSTSLSYRYSAIEQLCRLAKVGLACEARTGSEAKILTAERLRKLADQIEREE